MSAFAEADFMNDAGDGRGHGDGEGALRPLYLQVAVGGCGAAQPGRGAAEGAPPAGKAGCPCRCLPLGKACVPSCALPNTRRFDPGGLWMRSRAGERSREAARC